MGDEHFSHEVIEQFFRSELTRGENCEFVRHLLRQCPRCSELVREAAHGKYLQSLVRELTPDFSRFASGSRQVLDRILRLISPSRRRWGRGRRPMRAGLR